MNRYDTLNPWKLSPREFEALLLYIESGDYEAAGTAMGVQSSAVRSYVDRAISKMGVDNRIQAVRDMDRWRQKNPSGVATI